MSSEKLTDGKITQLLQEIRSGVRSSQEQLLELLYGELKALAKNLGARPGYTVSPTMLVHESYAKMFDGKKNFENRFHFFAMAARVMRHLLIDFYRKKSTEKRGSGVELVSIEDLNWELPVSTGDTAVKIADALELLEKIDENHCKILELKYFAGLTLKEISQGLELSTTQVHRELKAAESWLLWRLQRN